MKTDLKHHGIMGLKWGVRRYRGSDGRVVPDRYVAPAKAAQLRKEGGSTPSVNSSTTQGAKKQNASEMSFTELKNAVERLNLEKQYKALTAKEVSPGKKFINSVLNDSGKRAATTLTTKYLIKGGDKAIQELLKAIKTT